MKFTFDEAEILNSYLQEENTLFYEDLLNKIQITIDTTEDIELRDIVFNILVKLKTFKKENYSKLLELPVDHITVY